MSGIGPVWPTPVVPVAAVEAVEATFEARELLLAMLGAGNPVMHRRVHSVVRHAAIAPVMSDAPPSPDDEVLTVSFERVFTRAEVTDVLAQLRDAGA